MNSKIFLILLFQFSFLIIKSQNTEVKSIQKTIYTTLENSNHNIDDNRFVYFMLTILKNSKGELLDIYYLKSSSFKEDEKLNIAIENIKLNWKKNPTTYTTIYLPFVNIYSEKDNPEKENKIELDSFVKMVENFAKRKDLLVAKILYNVNYN